MLNFKDSLRMFWNPEKMGCSGREREWEWRECWKRRRLVCLWRKFISTRNTQLLTTPPLIKAWIRLLQLVVLPNCIFFLTFDINNNVVAFGKKKKKKLHWSGVINSPSLISNACTLLLNNEDTKKRPKNKWVQNRWAPWVKTKRRKPPFFWWYKHTYISGLKIYYSGRIQYK